MKWKIIVPSVILMLLLFLGFLGLLGMIFLETTLDVIMAGIFVTFFLVIITSIATLIMLISLAIKTDRLEQRLRKLSIPPPPHLSE